MSWGIKVIMAFVFFAGGIGVMVGISMSKNIDLVTENYYEKELKHQDKINMINRTNVLKDKIKLATNKESITIKFPDDFAEQSIEGKIHFYRAMDKKKDFEINIQKNESNFQEIKTSDMDKGSWKIQIDWKASGCEYFYESDLFIN